METIKNTLENNGCTIIINDQFSLVARCSNSYVIKSPNSNWNLHVPVEKLSQVSKKLNPKDPSPQRITVGKMVRNGNWSKMFDFHINNEVSYIIPQNVIEKSNDKVIQEILGEMEDQKALLNEDIQSFDIQKDFTGNIKKLSGRVNNLLTKKLKSSFEDTPIACHSKPIIQKYWTTSEGEMITYKIRSTCVVPEIHREVDNVLDSALERGKISQHNRYISSRLTPNKKLLLNKIDLFQKGSKTPFARFSVKNEIYFEEPDFMDQVMDLESKFSDKNSTNKKNIDISTFRKYIL
jgi:hypothetical protein